VLVQRVTRAAVTVDGEVVGAIGPGLVAFVGVATEGDDPATAAAMATKVAHLRIFADDDGRFNRSALDVGAAVLVVSQFTLYADTRRGRRPSFVGAARPEVAVPVIDHFVAGLRALGLTVATGRFGAHMAVEIVNDGPVTLWLDSADRLNHAP
jgi:D-tyrosyl-tRNA(Tyr) deacylase